MYTDGRTTSAVANPEGNPEEMFLDEVAHHNLSPLANTSFYPTINPQHTSLQEKAMKLMQKAKKNMRKTSFKKAAAQKFKEYDQKLEAITNINVSKVIEKGCPCKSYDRNKEASTYLCPESYKAAEQNSLNKSNENHPIHQTLYDTLYDSITLDQQALDAQDAELSFHKRTHDDLDPPNDHLEGSGLEKLKQQYKNDVELEYHVDQLKAIVLTEVEWNSGEGKVSKLRSFERHMSKSTKPHPNFYNDDFYYLVNHSTEDKYTTSLTKHYVASNPLLPYDPRIIKKFKKRSPEELKPRSKDTRRTSGNTTRNDPFPPFLLLEAQTQVLNVLLLLLHPYNVHMILNLACKVSYLQM
ncbi:hypothetical protein Tco_0821864 [Tanacetum coccineum]|uniref:Uncharacterized protein n=1 Tax=Tanacetum coccineum TaxID=301880 RepID=A0ABQ5ADF9_9ASTR